MERKGERSESWSGIPQFREGRRGEVRQVLWGDVQVDPGGNAFLKLRASTTKSGKIALQPVSSWLADLLAKRRPTGAKLSDKVFPSIPRMPRFYGDLEAAGIPRVDERGHVAVFHSLRHTFATWLWEAGANPRMIQELMRHSDLHQISMRYSDKAGLAMNDAVGKLPGFGLTGQRYTHRRTDFCRTGSKRVASWRTEEEKDQAANFCK